MGADADQAHQHRRVAGHEPGQQDRIWGQGEDWLGSTFAQIVNGWDGVGDGSTTYTNAALTAPAGSTGYFNTPRWVTATATRLLGDPGGTFFWHRGTSEFSRCRSSILGGDIFSDGFEMP